MEENNRKIFDDDLKNKQPVDKQDDINQIIPDVSFNKTKTTKINIPVIENKNDAIELANIDKIELNYCLNPNEKKTDRLNISRKTYLCKKNNLLVCAIIIIILLLAVSVTMLKYTLCRYLTLSIK